jgi:predicted lipoprotein with Yx(FWY)xxD motif
MGPVTSVSTPSATQPTPSESVPPPARGTLVTTADSQFGEILFDDTGQAIYLFDKEQTTSPECYDECADAWPPVLTDGAPMPAQGARADELGTTTRTDGTTQVTYAGHPLYYYDHEGKNQVRCHDVRDYGGLWLAVTPSGEAAAHWALIGREDSVKSVDLRSCPRVMGLVGWAATPVCPMRSTHHTSRSQSPQVIAGAVVGRHRRGSGYGAPT